MAEQARIRGRRTVANRVLLSYAVLSLAFLSVAAWSVSAQRRAAQDAELMRSGYLPLALVLRSAVAGQDTYNSQLNHITATSNPADKRVWFDTAVLVGRPKTFAEIRAALDLAFSAARSHARAAGVSAEFSARTRTLEAYLEADRDLLSALFGALEAGERQRAEQLRDDLVTRGHKARSRFGELESEVRRNVDGLLDEARARERRALQVLIAWMALSVIVGVGMALYARRVLRPLTLVTKRAQAVAEGDLAPHAALSSNDEIGELSATFEGMVAAIARANEELLSSERLATIGRMAAHVTHEIRNPLSSLALNVELLEEELVTSDDETRALLRAIKAEVERLTALSEQYLSVARRREPRFELEDVGDLVEEALAFLRVELDRHGVELVLDVAKGVPQAAVDEAQLKQVLMNLVRNAREAMPDGGQVRVSVTGDVDAVLLTVEDSGDGIADAVVDHLFEPFFTTKGHGTGLGLVVTREIVEAHGGSITCANIPEGGARFRVRLPLAAGLPAAVD